MMLRNPEPLEPQFLGVSGTLNRPVNGGRGLEAVRDVRSIQDRDRYRHGGVLAYGGGLCAVFPSPGR